MNIFIEIIKFTVYALAIVIISKKFLVPILRNLARSLNLESKTVGNIAGIATSMPEFLSVSFSAFRGLLDTSIYNIISSNFINLFLYSLSMILNKNIDKLKNKALKVDLIISLLTIIIPFALLAINIEMNLSIIPLLIFLFILFYTINKNSHNLYLDEYKEEEKIEYESKNTKQKVKIIIKHTLYLILTGISLFIFGNLLSEVVERLSTLFNVPQIILGITLGIVTSIPEVITFFEAQRYNNKQDEKMEGVIETTNNLLTSNLMNLCIIQSVGIFIAGIFI